MNDNLHLRLTGGLEALAGKPFLTLEDRMYSGAGFLTGSRQMARLFTELDLEPGTRVMVQVEKSPEALMLYLACLQTGLVLVPLNTSYTRRELAFFLSDARPSVLVCAPEKAEDAAKLAAEAEVEHTLTLGTGGDGTLMADSAACSPLSETVALSAGSLAALLYTSGTTGRPKGAMLSHGNLASNCAALIDTWQFSSTDKLIHALPLFHTHGLFVACNVTLAAGATMHFLPKLDVDRIIDLMPESTVLMGVPTFYTRLLRSPRLNRGAAGGMRLFISGSAPLRPETHRAFEARTGHAILERYGMTETNMNTSNPCEGPRKPGTVGLPLPGVEIRIVDRESGQPVPAGEAGMIEVRGPNVFRGYWALPEKTAAEFRSDGYFVTGDLGAFDDDGYLHIIGRDKDLVISGGLNVYPSEVEQQLDALPQIVESAVIGLPHADLGEAVTAVVVAQPDCEISEEEVKSRLEDRLAPFKRPKRVIAVPELPRNTMGKVQKNELRDRFAHLYIQESKETPCH